CPALRRQRLHGRIPGRAAVPRRQGPPDLCRDRRDPGLPDRPQPADGGVATGAERLRASWSRKSFRQGVDSGPRRSTTGQGGRPMEYMLLIYNSEKERASMSEAQRGEIFGEYRAFTDA